MAKPRKTTSGKFPFHFEKNGRHGRIKLWKSTGTYGTYFQFAGKKQRNSFKTFDAAYAYLEREFSVLDTDRANSLALHPINHDVKTYHELEQLLRDRGNGATLREAVEFFLAHHEHKRFSPKTVGYCADSFLAEERARNLSPAQIKNLSKHMKRFKTDFGPRTIHELTTKEISDWLASRKSSNGELWSAKTRRNARGSLVSLSLHAQNVLKAIPDLGKTEFQKIKNPKRDAKGEVEIYRREEIKSLLNAAIEHDIDLIPGVVAGCFEGLRPDEFHAENAKRKPLAWEAFNWQDQRLHVVGQKVRSKATRDVPFHSVAQAWLEPFKDLKGPIWRYSKAYDDKMKALCGRRGLDRRFDGFRHSYASYRIRHLKGDLAQLAAEMGNSPAEIINSYKRNVSDKDADEWFSIMPPAGYLETVKSLLKLRQAA